MNESPNEFNIVLKLLLVFELTAACRTTKPVALLGRKLRCMMMQNLKLIEMQTPRIKREKNWRIPPIMLRDHTDCNENVECGLLSYFQSFFY